MARSKNAKKKNKVASPYFTTKVSWLMYVILMLLLSLIIGTAVTGLFMSG